MKHKKVLIVLLLVIGAVYANSLVSGFVWDDNTLIIQKQAFFSNPENAVRILTSPDAPLGVKTPYYRPLNTLTYMVDHFIFGLHPFWYHLENVLLHAVVVMLFYLLLLELFEDEWLAFFSALLFAVYPVNAESVNWISARNVILCSVFSVASLLFLARGKKAISFLAYFLALLSKEPAVVLPFFLLSLGLTSSGNRFKARKNVLIGFFAVTSLYFVLRHLVLGTFTGNSGLDLSLSNLKLISSVYFENFKLFVFPFKLNSRYTEAQMYFSPIKAVSAIACVLFLLYFALKKESPEPVRFGAQWILWGLLPISGIIKIPSGPVAERYQYTVLFGAVLMIGYALSRLRTKKVFAGTVIAAALTLALGARTFERNFVWKDDISFFSGMIRANPANGEAYCDLGTVYGEMGEADKAIREFQSALALGYPQAWVNIGIAHTHEGRLDDAVQDFKKALVLNPKNTEAMAHLGVAYEQEGNLEQAEREYKETLALDPGLAMTQVNLGVVYAKEGRFEDAERQLKGALTLDPGLDLARMDLGIVYGKEGRFQDAIGEFQAALKLNPGNSQARELLSKMELRM